MITPKPFQQTYIGNVLTLFRGAKSHLDEVASDFERRRVFAYNGSCLLKAPTGAGKTLIAGTVAEQFSQGGNGGVAVVRSVQGARRPGGDVAA